MFNRSWWRENMQPYLYFDQETQPYKCIVTLHPKTFFPSSTFATFQTFATFRLFAMSALLCATLALSHFHFMPFQTFGPVPETVIFISCFVHVSFVLESLHVLSNFPCTLLFWDKATANSKKPFSKVFLSIHFSSIGYNALKYFLRLLYNPANTT